jgi:hypothetical protein
MVSMSDKLKERNILKLILIVRFACVTLDVGHPISESSVRITYLSENDEISVRQTSFSFSIRLPDAASWRVTNG